MSQWTDIVEIWNSFAKKQCNHESLIVEYKVLSIVSQYGFDNFMQAIKNYKEVCDRPDTNKWDFNLHNFSVKCYKYLPDVFDIDNFIKTNFIREEEKTKLFPIAGRTCGVDNCKMPAVYKSSGAYDHFYCYDHMPEKAKGRYRQ